MTNWKKKSIMVVLSMLLVVMSIVQPALAAENQPRAKVCEICGRGVLVEKKTYSSWIPDKEVKCTHFVYGSDIIYKRTVYTETKCNACQQGFTGSTRLEYKTECEGSATP